jgi:hypothetical protein
LEEENARLTERARIWDAREAEAPPQQSVGDTGVDSGEWQSPVSRGRGPWESGLTQLIVGFGSSFGRRARSPPREEERRKASSIDEVIEGASTLSDEQKRRILRRIGRAWLSQHCGLPL